MKKKAVVLLITLGFLSVITILIMQVLDITKSSSKDFLNIKRQNQHILFMQDFLEILKTQDPKLLKEGFVDKQEFPIFDQKSGVSISIFCSSLDSKLDFNKLVACKKPICARVLKNYLKEKEIADEEFFLALLKDSVDPKEGLERMSGSKIVLDDKKFSTGCILNFKTIKKIQKRYFHLTKDPNIYKITKEDFFRVFYLFDKKHVDDNNSAPNDDVAMLLDCMENDDMCKEKFIKINNILKKITSCSIGENNQTIQTKYLIQCSLKQYKNDEVHNIIFKYNLDPKAKKRVESIDEFF